jgi:hypothetical protein
MLGPDDLLFALITGVAVVGITLLGDRLGGRLGGLLATAPVTTSAAHVLIATSVPPGLAAGRVLQGVAAMLASTFGIVAFFYAVKYTRGRPSNARLAAGLAVYVSFFLALTWVFATYPLHPLSAFVILFATHAALAFTFMREPVPVLKDAATPRRPRRSAAELAGRFAAGTAVVLVIRVLLDVYPPFAGALAVVPAVFLVSLTVMGVSHDAPFAARAAQAGLFGTTAVAVFVLTIAGGLYLRLPGGIWPLLPLGWAAYALTLASLGRLHARIAR